MTLKEHLKQIDPNMDDKLIEEFVAMLDTKITEAKDQGFNEGISKVSEMDEEYAVKMEGLFEEIKVKHETELTALEERLTTEHAQSLQEALDKMDDEHVEMFNEALEAQDELQSHMLEQLVEMIDEDHLNKLNTIEEAFKTQYETTITEKVNEFIDTYIAESMPTREVVDGAKLQRLEECMSSIREILVVNDDFVQTEVKEALEDAQTQLDEKQEKINSLMVENMDIRKQVKKSEAVSLLEKKTKGMKPAQAAFVTNFFEGVNDPKVISEKLNDAVKAFKADETAKKEEVIEEKRGTSVEIPDEPKPEVIEESVENDPMDLYVGKIHRSYSIENNLDK